MRLLPERQLLYTLPIPAAQLSTVEEYCQLRAKAEPQIDDEQRMDALKDELPSVTVWRLTVRQVSALRQGHYEALRDEAATLVQEYTGKKIDTLFKQGQAAGAAWSFLVDAYNACSMLASLTKLEECHHRFGSEPGNWQAIELPDEWRSLREFLDSIPPNRAEMSLYGLWLDAALDVNPDLWLKRTDDSAKKFGAASAL